MVLTATEGDYLLTGKGFDQGRKVPVFLVVESQLSIVVSAARIRFQIVSATEHSVVVRAADGGDEFLGQLFDLFGDVERVLVAVAELSAHIEAERVHLAVVRERYHMLATIRRK